MKFAIVFVAILAIALAHPLDDHANAQVLRYDNDNIGVDGYKWGFETSDGKNANEEGHIENAGSEDEGIEVRGAYSYIDQDGQTISVTYTAGRDGFVPVGAHIPTA